MDQFKGFKKGQIVKLQKLGAFDELKANNPYTIRFITESGISFLDRSGKIYSATYDYISKHLKILPNE